MININDHVVEIDGIKYIPYDIAIKAMNNIFTDDITNTISDLENKLTELKNNLINEINFNIIDLTDTLLASKKEAQLYHKTDSHWNDIGAFIGYSKTIKEISNFCDAPKTMAEHWFRLDNSFSIPEEKLQYE